MKNTGGERGCESCDSGGEADSTRPPQKHNRQTLSPPLRATSTARSARKAHEKQQRHSAAQGVSPHPGAPLTVSKHSRVVASRRSRNSATVSGSIQGSQK